MRNNMNKSIEDIKFGFCKNVKYFLISTLVIILAGIVVWACCGFNQSFDITGGYAVQVDYLETNVNSDDMYTKTADEVESFVEDNGFSVYSTQKVGENLNISVVIKYQTNGLKTAEIEENNVSLYNALVDKYGADNVEEIVNIASTYNTKTILKLSIGLIVALVAVVVYMSIRYHYSMGIATAFAFALDMLLMLALTAICRIKVGEIYTAVVGAVGVMSLLFNAILFTRIRNHNRKEIDNGEEFVDNAIKHSTAFNILIGIALVIMLFFVFNAVSAQGGYALALILSVCITLFTSTFISAPLWRMIFRKETKSAPIEIEQTK